MMLYSNLLYFIKKLMFYYTFLVFYITIFYFVQKCAVYTRCESLCSRNLLNRDMCSLE